MPVFPRTATFRHEILFLIKDYGFLCTFNATDMPATVVPVGLSKDGLPLGLQVNAFSVLPNKVVTIYSYTYFKYEVVITFVRRNNIKKMTTIN